MNIKDFNAVSIKGRAAYAICCLERAIEKFDDKNPTWDFVLNKLWEFTDTKFIPEWQELSAELIPGVILANNSPSEFEFIAKGELKSLKSLYKNTHLDLCKIVEAIFDIGSIEISDENIHGNSEDTLNALSNVVGLCEYHKIELPSQEIFKKYKFSEAEGWGKRFNHKNIKC